LKKDDNIMAFHKAGKQDAVFTLSNVPDRCVEK